MSLYSRYEKLQTLVGTSEFTTDSERSTIARRGFTAGTYTFPDEGQSLNQELHLLDSFQPVPNNKTQLLTLNGINVDLNASTPFVTTVRPISGVNIYRESTVSGLLETSANDLLSSDTLSLGGILVGNKDLVLDGVIEAYVPSGETVSYTNEAPDLVGSTFATPTFATGRATVSMDSDFDYGHWPVSISFVANLTNFDSFSLPKGSTAHDDETLIDAVTGEYVVLTDISNLVDTNGKFLRDFLVDPSKHSIVKSFSSDKATFYARSRIPEGTSLSVGTYVAGTGNGAFDASVSNKCLVYQYGTTPKYQVSFSPGTEIPFPITLEEGFETYSGLKIPVGSTVSDADEGFANLVLPYVRGDKDTLLPPSTVFTDIVSDGSLIKIPAGFTSTLFQLLPAFLTTYADLHLSDAIFGQGVSLESKLTIDNEFEVTDDMTLSQDSLLKKDTFLPKGSVSLKGCLIRGGIVLEAGSEVKGQFEVQGPFHIQSSLDNNGVVLDTGSIIRGPFSFAPNNTYLPSGTVLPAVLKVIQSMGVVFDTGMEFIVDTHFGSAASFYGNNWFKPNGSFPAQTYLRGSFTLPTGTTIDHLSNFGVQLPVPPSTHFLAGSLLPVGTTFSHGAKVPQFDLMQEASPVSNGTTTVGSFAIFNDGTEGWLIIKGGTAYAAGMVFPEGSILSKCTTPGLTTGSGVGTAITLARSTASTGAGDCTINEGEWTPDLLGRSPGADDITIVPGTPLITSIKMLTSIVLPYDLLIKFSDFNPDMFQFIRVADSFTLSNDLQLISDYVVEGVNTVYWAANRPIPSKFTLTVPYSFTTSGCTLNKAVKFNTRTTASWINGIVAEGPLNYVKFPAGYTLTSPIKLATPHEVSMVGNAPIKSTIDLPVKTKLVTSSGSVRLISPMVVTGNFTVDAPITQYGSFVAQGGMTLLKSQFLPGNVSVQNGQVLPDNVVLPNDVTLAADLVVSESSYTLKSGSKLAPKCELARGTFFNETTEFDGGITLAPILSLKTTNRFALNSEVALNTDMYFPYMSTEGTVPLPRVDLRDLLLKYAVLSQELDELHLKASV